MFTSVIHIFVEINSYLQKIVCLKIQQYKNLSFYKIQHFVFIVLFIIKV